MALGGCRRSAGTGCFCGDTGRPSQALCFNKFLEYHPFPVIPPGMDPGVDSLKTALFFPWFFLIDARRIFLKRLGRDLRLRYSQGPELPRPLFRPRLRALYRTSFVAQPPFRDRTGRPGSPRNRTGTGLHRHRPLMDRRSPKRRSPSSSTVRIVGKTED